MILFLDYTIAGAAGVALGMDLFPRFLRRFVKFQYVRMLKEDERERKRDLRSEVEVYADPVEPLDIDPRDVPPPAFEVPPSRAEPSHGVTCPGGCRGSRMVLGDHSMWEPCPGRTPDRKTLLGKMEERQRRQRHSRPQMLADVEFYKQQFRHAQEMLEALKMPDAVIAPEVEVEAIYEFGSKEPVAFIRVADGAQVEQMLCPECYMGYDYKIVARYYEPGSHPYPNIPEDAPKCKHCNGKGKIPVTRMP